MAKDDQMTRTLDIVELLLTAELYNECEDLGESDLPPYIRKRFIDLSERKVKRPVSVKHEDVQQLYGINGAKSLVEPLPFVEYEEFGSQLRLTVPDLGLKWFAKQPDAVERANQNPVLAYYYENYDGLPVSYEKAKENTRPKEADREWIDGLIADLAEDDEEAEEMLKLVHILAPEEVKQPLSEIVLTEEQEEEVKKIMKAIQHRDYLAEIGLREIGKLLFIGPPGTGKTSTARALSERIHLPFLEVKLSMITSQYLGETSKNIDKVFELAKKLSPCILFIDEFDFVAKTRTSDEHAALKRAVNTLLKAIDEISLVEDGVLLIGATNHPKLLDHAAWRRFDEIVKFPLPSEEMRRRILENILGRIEGDLDIDELARMTDGFSGSDLRLIVRESVLSALVEERTRLTQEDLVEAAESFNERIDMKLDEY